MSSRSLPPLPEMNMQPAPGAPGAAPSAGGGPGSPSGESITPSAFSGGLPGMYQSMQQIEAGLQQLAQQLPSLAPMCAGIVSQLRMAVPGAMSAGASGQDVMGGSQSPLAAATTGLPLPPGA